MALLRPEHSQYTSLWLNETPWNEPPCNEFIFLAKKRECSFWLFFIASKFFASANLIIKINLKKIQFSLKIVKYGYRSIFGQKECPKCIFDDSVLRFWIRLWSLTLKMLRVHPFDFLLGSKSIRQATLFQNTSFIKMCPPGPKNMLRYIGRYFNERLFSQTLDSGVMVLYQKITELQRTNI